MSRAHRLQMRLFHALAVSMMLLLGMLAAAALFGRALERPYLSYRNVPFPAHGPVYPGQAVPLEVERCNDRPGPHSYQVSHQLRNLRSGATVLLAPAWVELAPGCTLAISRIHVIPPDTPPGRYVLQGSAEIDGLLVRHHVGWESAPFEVLPLPEN